MEGFSGCHYIFLAAAWPQSRCGHREILMGTGETQETGDEEQDQELYCYYKETKERQVARFGGTNKDKVKELLHTLCNKIARSGEWSSQMDGIQVSVIYCPPPPKKKTNSQKCAYFRTVNLTSHASEVLLKITPRVCCVEWKPTWF